MNPQDELPDSWVDGLIMAPLVLLMIAGPVIIFWDDLIYFFK